MMDRQNPVQNWKQLDYSSNGIGTYTRRKGMVYGWVFFVVIAVICFLFSWWGACLINGLVGGYYGYQAYIHQNDIVKHYDYSSRKCLNYDRGMCVDCSYKGNILCKGGYFYTSVD